MKARLTLILTLYLVAELIAYILFLVHFSILSGLFIGVGSTVLGLLTLKAISRRGAHTAAAVLAGGVSTIGLTSLPLTLLGAILLLLPGFLSNLIGIGLVICGGWTLLRQPAARADREIDLSPDEWRRQPDEPPR